MADKDNQVSFERKALKGSRFRCLMLTSGSREQVADRLHRLVTPHATIAGSDVFMPRGFLWPDEAKLGETPNFLSDAHRELVTAWWLAVRPKANTPNWDIVSTCKFGDTPGLLLVEAKAHTGELDVSGKPLKPATNRKNHDRIAEAITEASTGLNSVLAGWSLTRDSHYQLCNRFAWAWKVASLGVPVVLVYLGFLHADEMGSGAFKSATEWDKCVRSAGCNLIPDGVWQKGLKVGSTPLVPLIRTCDIRFEMHTATSTGG